MKLDGDGATHPRIHPDNITRTTTVTGPTASLLMAQVDQTIKEMMQNPETEYEILEIIPAFVISYRERPAPKDEDAD